MFFPVTASFYLAREVLVYSAIGYLAAFPIVLIPNLVQRFDQFSLPWIDLRELLGILGWIVPLVSGYALPVAFLFGSMMALGRLTTDSEIVALRANGLGPAPLAWALLGVGALVSVLSGILIVGVEATAQREISRASRKLASEGGLIDTGRFQHIGERMIFVRDRSSAERLEGVMISDWSRENTTLFVFAEAAQLHFDEEGIFHLLLENGDIRIEPDPAEEFEEYRLSFANLDYAFPLNRLRSDHWRYWPDQMGMTELRDAIRRIETGGRLEGLRYRTAHPYQAQLHRRMAIPLAPILFGLIALSLGQRGAVHGRARALILAGIVLVAYYTLFAFGQGLALSGRVSPALAIWMPNVLLAAVGVAMIRRV